MKNNSLRKKVFFYESMINNMNLWDDSFEWSQYRFFRYNIGLKG